MFCKNEFIDVLLSNNKIKLKNLLIGYYSSPMFSSKLSVYYTTDTNNVIVQDIFTLLPDIH